MSRAKAKCLKMAEILTIGQWMKSNVGQSMLDGLSVPEATNVIASKTNVDVCEANIRSLISGGCDWPNRKFKQGKNNSNNLQLESDVVYIAEVIANFMSAFDVEIPERLSEIVNNKQ